MSDPTPTTAYPASGSSQASAYPAQPWEPVRPPNDSSVKIPHLVFGLFFLGLAGAWALVAGDVVSAASLAVLAPGLLILAGVAGLAASLANARNRARRDRDQERDRRERTMGSTPTHETTDHDPTEEIR